jgi:hypothetical protein
LGRVCTFFPYLLRNAPDQLVSKHLILYPFSLKSELLVHQTLKRSISI